jgi:hypothetical protein
LSVKGEEIIFDHLRQFLLITSSYQLFGVNVFIPKKENESLYLPCFE